jgi:arylsulfatase A-like enzyme
MVLSLAAALVDEKPNIIFIFADDMGVGDVSYSTGTVKTPNIDRLATEGMTLMDVHTTAAICTPSRYGFLTGRYNWRTRLQDGVFVDATEEPLIKDNEETVATLLRDNGYNTACIGKWHLGIEWEKRDDNYTSPRDHVGNGWEIDYTKPAKVTPTSSGFDSFYGIQSSLDIPPYVYIDNDTAVGNVDVTKAFFHRKGPSTKEFDAHMCLKTWANKSVSYIDSVAREEKPFFLYLALSSPHTPHVPSAEWVGKSHLGPYGDFLLETDWVVGELLQALDRLKIADNTMVVFTTDNGASPAGITPRMTSLGHFPNGPLRGHKGDVYVSCYTIVLPFFSCCEVAVSLIHLLLPASIL